jgi:hypothetical protein
MRAFKLVISLALFISCTSSTHAGDDWTFATDWVGKYPSMPVGAAKSGLLSQPEIKAPLKKLLPKFEISNLSGLTSEAPVRDIEGLLVVNKCRPHNCPSDMAMVVIDVKKARLWVSFFSREESRVSTRWYGTEDDYSVLPESIKKDFLTRHGD